MTMCSVKCFFIFFMSLFLASGVALIIIGALHYTTYSQIDIFTGNTLTKIAIVIIAVGITIVLVSILGYIGAFTNNSCVVTGFICILIVIMLLEVCTGAALYLFLQKGHFLKLYKDISFNARLAIHDYSPKDRDAIDRIQKKFSCCGADIYTDWHRSVGWNNIKAVPDSCCVVRSEGCGQDKTTVHTKGCILVIKVFLLKNLLWIGAVCITLGIAEILGVLVGVCFCLNIKGKNYENLS